MTNKRFGTGIAGTGSAKGSLPLKKKSEIIDQSAVVYDVLSEGEIEGLVDGAYTIYLDGVPVLDKTLSTTYSSKQSSNTSYDASTGTITDNQSGNMFSGLSVNDGTRYVRIDGGAAVGNANVSANTNLVTPSSSGGITFANTHVAGNLTTLVDMQPKIRIAGAGLDGGIHIATITSFDSTNNTVNISPPPKTTVTNAVTTVDLVDQAASFSGSNATIAPVGQGVDRSNVPTTLSSPSLSEDSAPIYNFNNFSYAFRTGHRHQKFIKSPEGVGSGAVGVSIGSDLPASSQSALGMTSEPRNVDNRLRDHAGEEMDAITHAGVNIAASLFNVSDPSIIDQLKVTINHPTGLNNMDSEDGNSGNGWVELRIMFSYTRDGQTFEETVFGLDDMASIPREKDGSRPVNVNMQAHDAIISGKIATQFATVFSFDTEQFQPFDDFTIKVRRYTPDPYKITNKSYNNITQVSFAEAIIEDKLNYPYTALAAIMVDSKDATTVPQRHYKIRGIKCKVPTNYVPKDTLDQNGNRTTVPSYNRNISTGALESTYQDWDGKFRGDKKEFSDPNSVNHLPVYTTNPAWIFFDILTNERYGLGKYLDPDGSQDLIDKYQLFEIAKYCDELVSDGDNGLEPRFECNVYITKSAEAIKILKQLMSVFRGILLWHNGEISLNAQQEKAPIFTFTKGNVVEGGFTYQYPSNRVRANQIRVTWNDPENHYKPAVELVEDSENIAKTGRIVEKTTLAFGCTSQAQAHRVGKYHLLTEINDSEVVSFSSGIGTQVLRPGDLIEVQDADRDNVQLSGRVSSGASTTVIPVDRSVALSSAANSDLTLIFPKSGAYLAQPSAVINSVVYNQGDLILQAKNSGDSLYNLDSQEDSVNARDDDGDVLDIAWSEDARIETKAISSYNATHVVVSSAFSAVPDEEVIFAISQTTASGEKLAGSPQTYMISQINEGTDKAFAISATKHTVGKFDEVDRGWSIPSIPDVMRPPKSSDGVPSPRNVTLKVLKGLVDDADDVDISSALEERFIAPRLDVYWGIPLSLRTDDNDTQIESPYEHLQNFQIEHNLFTQQSTQGKLTFDRVDVSPERQSYTFKDIPKAGTYIIRIRTINTSGQPSPFIQKRITINPEKPAKNLEPIARKGGILTSGFNIDSSNALVQFTESTYNFTPAESDLQTITVTGGTTAQTSCSFANLPSGNTGYLLWDYSDTTDPLKAIEYVVDNSGSETFRFAKNLDATAFVQKTGTATVTAGSSLVTGTGTSFTTEYEAGDLFKFHTGSTHFIATINHIYDNTRLEVAYNPTANLSNKNIFAQRIQPNIIKDTIIGEVANTSGTFSIVNYASGNKGTDAYTINGTNENHNFPSDAAGAVSDFASFSNLYTVKKGSIAYSFASSGTALNTFGLSKTDSNCTSAINSSTGVITVSAITQTNATITVTVTDRYSNETIATRVISLGKSIPGAAGAGSDSRTVNLTAGDYSIAYNSGGTAPQPSGTITLTATAQNFSNPYFKFTGDGISDETSYTDGNAGDADTFSFSIPSSINTSPQTITVGVADGNQTQLAFDSITITSLQQGSPGYSTIISNEAHTFPATKLGVVSDFTNSGTFIEVFRGATRLTPVANTSTPTNDQYSVTTNSDTNISVGSFTLNTATNSANVTVGNHSSFTTGADTAEIEYSINIENELTVTKAQTFTKSKSGDDGSPGGTGPRTATGYIYYQSASGSAPTNPSNAGVSYNFGTSLLSGGVIGTGGTNWNQIQPTYTGSNSNKYWYAYWSVVEDEFNDSTPTITFSIAYQGQNFTGLVTFTGTNQITDGSNTTTALTSGDLGSSGTTTIDGGRITTGTINANRISIAGKDVSDLNNDSGFTNDDKANTATNSAAAAASTAGSAFSKANTATNSAAAAASTAGSAFSKANTATNSAATAQSTADSKVTHATVNSSSTIVGGGVGGWGITTYHLAGGGIVGNFTTSDSTQGNASFLNTGGLLLGSDGFISANQFYIDTAGNAKFKGALEAATGTFSGSITVAAFNTAAATSTLAGTAANAFSAANAAASTAGSAFSKANTATNSAASAASTAGSAFSKANTATNSAASAASTAGSAFSKANTATNSAAAAASTAGSAFGKANTATNSAAAAASTASSAFGKANTATNSAAAAASTAGNAYGKANTATNSAAAAATTAGQAYGKANTATNSAAAAQSTADSKVTHAAVNNSSTVVGGGVGGWGISTFHLAGGGIVGNFTTSDSTQGNGSFLNTGGILLGSDGFISSNTFMIDTAGNAKFKGTLEGNDVTVAGTLTTANITLASTGANVSGTTIGTFFNNDMNYRYLGDVGTGAGYYVGNILVSGVGGTAHVKTLHFHVSDGSNLHTNSTTTVTFATQQESGPFSARLCRNIDHAIHESRVFPPVIGTNGTGGTSTNPDFASRTQGMIPVSFKYEGTGTVNLYVAAQGDNNSSKLGFIKYNFVKFGTTDPSFSFSNLIGQSTSTTLYANTQVTGGFQGTKTVSIAGGSAQFKIDNGSFGTGNQQVSNGSYINVQMTTSSLNLTAVSTTVTIGGIQRGWSLTTGGTVGGGGGGGGGLPGGGCLVYGSNILMADGTTKKVQDIAVGDSLEAITDTTLDESNENAYVTWTASSLVNTTPTTSTVEEVFVDSYAWFFILNEKVHATYEHPFLILRGETYMWKRAEDIVIGDFLVTNNLVLEKVWRKQRIDQEVQTYNFNVEDADTYIVENVITHNVSELEEK